MSYIVDSTSAKIDSVSTSSRNVSKRMRRGNVRINSANKSLSYNKDKESELHNTTDLDNGKSAEKVNFS